MEFQIDEDSTQPPEQEDSPPQHFPIDVLDTQESYLSSEGNLDDDKPRMKFDVHFDPTSSQCKPLKRHFTSKINQNTLPYYTPEGQNCCSYTAVIIKLFKTYTQQLIAAQRRSKTTVPWGKPVLPGRHHSKTIDFKRRGCLSVNMDTSTDENEDFSPQNLLPDVPNLNDMPKMNCESPPLQMACQSNIQEVSKSYLGPRDLKLDDFDVETPIFSEIESVESDDDAGDDSDFVPEKESSKQRRAKPKSKVTRKRKKSISPIEITTKKTPQKIVGDFFMQINDNRRNSKDSKPSQSNSKDSKFNQSKCSSKDDTIPGSQDSNEMLNPHGDIYPTQVTQQKRTPRLGRPVRKKPKVETIPKIRISVSSDDELLDKHLKDVSVKKMRLNPIAMLRTEDVFNEDSTLRSKSPRTYQRGHKVKNKTQEEVQDTNSIDFDQLLSLSTLHYTPQSTPTTEQTRQENVLSQKNPTDLSDISSESPLKTVKKRKSFSLWDSEDDLDSHLIKQATSNQSKTVVNVKPMQRHVSEVNRPSTSRVTSPIQQQSKVNIVSPIRRLPQKLEPVEIPNQEEDEVEEVLECPLCSNNFPLTMIERHAATCGEEDTQDQEVQLHAREEVERQTRSKISRN